MNLWKILNEIITFIKSLPLKDLTTGVVVPLVSAYTSYRLVQTSTKKKESNRLNIDIELLTRELLKNKESIVEFIELNSEYKKLTEEIEINMPFSHHILYDVLIKLKNISDEYFYDGGDHIFDKPNCLYIDSQKIEALNEEIEEIELKVSNNPILEEKRQITVAQLQESKQQLFEAFKKNKDRDIYKEFIYLQTYIDKNIAGDLMWKSNHYKLSDQSLVYIYESIKNFNNLTNQTKQDVIKIYKDLFIFTISKDELNIDNFDEENFDFYYKSRHGTNPIYDTCKKFIKLLICEKKLTKFSFSYYDSTWKDVYSNLVMINDSSLFICICDYYESYELFIQSCFKNGKNNKKLDEIENKCNDFIETLNILQEKLHLKQLKIQKWCK